MHKILFGIFAHPDDEAFGPAATLLKETAEGTELHLICLTAGENGTNPDNVPDLGEVRLQEWHQAGKLLGAASMTNFSYGDGTLSNSSQREIAAKIIEKVKNTAHDRMDIEIEFMSLDLNGFTGHVDHIVAARAACLAFYKLRDDGLPMKRVRLFCWTHDQQPSVDTGFVFMEPGRLPEEINETIDASDFAEQIDAVMRTHHTQRGDYQWMMEKRGHNATLNHFIVKE